MMLACELIEKRATCLYETGQTMVPTRRTTFRPLRRSNEEIEMQRVLAPATATADNNLSGSALLDLLMVKTIRLNARLIAFGDKITRDLGMTSARWQVLATVAKTPMSALQLARSLDMQRQSVQSTMTRLVDDGLLLLVDNPDHSRAKLARPTKDGVRILEQIWARQATYLAAWSDRLETEDLQVAIATIETVEAAIRNDVSL